MTQLEQEYMLEKWRELPSLRDRFAMAALERAICLSSESDGGCHMHSAAMFAYEVADAMLEARKAITAEQGE